MSCSIYSLTGSVQPKNGRLYAVVNCKIDEKRKVVWRTLNLKQGTSQAKINKEYRRVINELKQELSGAEVKTEIPVAEMPIYDYLCEWLEWKKAKIQANTITSYSSMIHRRIKEYFTARPNITVGNITKKDIIKFYNSMYAKGAKGSSVLHFHAMLHSAFKQAYMDDEIQLNPFDKVERPKREHFVGAHYSEEEWKKLLRLTKTDDIYPAIMLAAGLGLRRSEALGARWSRIDWDEKTILLDTKIVEYEDEGTGEKVVEAVEQMKNKSSRRTLPLPDMVYEMLKEQKAQQELYKSMFGESYNMKNDDYICVTKLGDLISPGYTTRHFSQLLKKLGMRHIRFHDLRHTFASILINRDVPIPKISDFLGHSDIATTANIYAHLDKASKKSSAMLISDIFANKLENEES
jgi:integrase